MESHEEITITYILGFWVGFWWFLVLLGFFLLRFGIYKETVL